MDFQGVGAVFEGVGDTRSLSGELFGFADGDETGAETIGERGREDKAAGFDAGDYIDGMTVVMCAEAVNQLVEPLFVFQKRGQIVEEDSGLRVVWNFTDQFLEIVHSTGSWLSVSNDKTEFVI